MKLKRRSYRHLRPKSKVDKAILMAEKIQRNQDPLRAPKPMREPRARLEERDAFA